jgi:hypothetical protein
MDPGATRVYAHCCAAPRRTRYFVPEHLSHFTDCRRNRLRPNAGSRLAPILGESFLRGVYCRSASSGGAGAAADMFKRQWPDAGLPGSGFPQMHLLGSRLSKPTSSRTMPPTQTTRKRAPLPRYSTLTTEAGSRRGGASERRAPRVLTSRVKTVCANGWPLSSIPLRLTRSRTKWRGSTRLFMKLRRPPSQPRAERGVPSLNYSARRWGLAAGMSPMRLTKRVCLRVKTPIWESKSVASTVAVENSTGKRSKISLYWALGHGLFTHWIGRSFSPVIFLACIHNKRVSRHPAPSSSPIDVDGCSYAGFAAVGPCERALW